ncbi:MAG TPA: hypothetical protein VL485_25200 [Ktedonobacteraceae bacterium]|jgi:hypothetical protein|nr:hypothetical protein [Ktedonobacteraceae bacterium]
MPKLQDMFTQARRAQSGGGMGFLGKNKSEIKPKAAALVVEFPTVQAGGAEAALKAGADGLLFTWDGKDKAALEAIKEEITSASSNATQLVVGLQITNGFAQFNRDTLNLIKEQGVNYIILPFTAPARILAVESKDLEKVVTIPMRDDPFYPIHIRNLTGLDGIAAVVLDFALAKDLANMTIEDILTYQAVREAVRFPAFMHVPGTLQEDEAHTLRTLGLQAMVLTAGKDSEKTQEQIRSLRVLLEKLQQEEKENETSTLRH